MATYFDFEKKHAHINKDDIYVKHGEVKDDKLVLEYSVEGMDPLSVSLSAFDKMTYIDDAEFKDNNLILKHNIRIPDLSVNLSSLDKHISEVKKADDENALSLCFSDGTFISVDTTKFAEDYYVTSSYVDGNNLVLLRNNGLAPLVADLDKFNTHIESWEIIGNDLVLRYNDETPALSVALDRFHKHIDQMQIDDCDLLTLRYADDVAAPLSADLSRYTRNWFVNEADLCGDVIVLKRNSADAGDDLSVDASSLNNYIKSATIVGKTLVLAYNSDRFAPLSIDIADFIKDYYIADAKLCADSKLHLKYNADLDDIVVDLHDLDDKIDDIKQENDTIWFHRTNGTLPVINLSKYVNNNLKTMYIHGNALVLKFDDGRTKDVSLDKFDKHIAGYAVDENCLSLYYNDNKGSIAIDKSKFGKNVSAARIEDNVLWLDYNDRSDSISVSLPVAPNAYISSGKTIDGKLVIEYEDKSKNVSIDTIQLSNAEVIDNKLKLSLTNHDPIVVNLAQFANTISDVEYVNNNIILNFANGRHTTLDLSKFNMFINNAYVGDSTNANKLILTYNNPVRPHLEINLDKFDKYIADASIEDGNIVAKYNNDKGKAFKIPLDDINYELTSGAVDDDNLILLRFTNGKDDVVIDASNLKSPDTYISSIVLDDEDNLVFDYNRADMMAKAISLHKIAKNDYIKSGSYNEDTHYLTLNYNNQDEKDPLSIYIPASSIPALVNVYVDLDNIIHHQLNDGTDIKIPISRLNYELTSGVVDDSNNICLKFTNGKDDVVIDANKIKSTDTYVSNGRFDADDKSLVLSYNKDRSDIRIKMDVLSAINFDAADDTSVLSIALTVQQIVEAFGGNR